MKMATKFIGILPLTRYFKLEVASLGLRGQLCQTRGLN